MTGRAATRDEKLAALALWVLAFAALWSTEAAVGFTRDESVYFAAAEGYASWFRLLVRAPAQAFTDSAIVRAWDYNHEHPVLMKTLFGLSHLLFHDGLGLRSAAAFRLPAFAMAALVPALCFLLGTALYGRTAGWFAALSFLLVPRQYFNAELAAFDMPVAAMWLLVVYCFWRALEDTRWGVLCGVAFGLALATKHNALFLPFVLTPFALWRAWSASQGSPEARVRLGRFVGLFAAVAVLYGLLLVFLGGGAAFQKKFLLLSPHTLFFVGLAVGSVWLLRDLRSVSLPVTRALLPVAAMAVLGPVLFYLHWPYLWHAPVDRTAWYLAFHATHNHYAWFYLGTLMRGPPFPLTYVVVKTALTVPTSLFAPMVTGFVALVGRALLSLSARTRDQVRMPTATEALVGVNAVTSILVISHPQVPHFGGVKHWFPSMPFLGILAGAAVARGCFALWELLKTRRPSLPSLAVTVPVFALLLVPALLGLVRVFPYGTAAYSELAGGLPGAATLGMQRQFWSSHVTGVLPWINAHAKPGARIYLHEVNGFSFRDYQRNGMLRTDVRPVNSPADADIVAYQYHQEFREHEFLTWQAFGTRTPVTGLYLDETPQVIVYQRPE